MCSDRFFGFHGLSSTCRAGEDTHADLKLSLGLGLHPRQHASVARWSACSVHWVPIYPGPGPAVLLPATGLLRQLQEHSELGGGIAPGGKIWVSIKSSKY